MRYINLHMTLTLTLTCDMRRFRSFNHSTCKTVLNLMEAVYLRLRKIVVERVTVVKFTVDNRGCNGSGCFRIKVRSDTAELTNMRIAGLRNWWDLIRESTIFIKDKTKVACRMSGIEWRVVYFKKLLFKTNDEKFSLRRVMSKKICSGAMLFTGYLPTTFAQTRSFNQHKVTVLGDYWYLQIEKTILIIIWNCKLKIIIISC